MTVKQRENLLNRELKRIVKQIMEQEEILYEKRSSGMITNSQGGP